MIRERLCVYWLSPRERVVWADRGTPQGDLRVGYLCSVRSGLVISMRFERLRQFKLLLEREHERLFFRTAQVSSESLVDLGKLILGLRRLSAEKYRISVLRPCNQLSTTNHVWMFEWIYLLIYAFVCVFVKMFRWWLVEKRQRLGKGEWTQYDTMERETLLSTFPTKYRIPLVLKIVVTWLILPVVICLSQRLSHACLSISTCTVKLRMAH